MVLFLKKLLINTISREQPEEKGMFLKRVGNLLVEGYSLKDSLIFLQKIEKGTSKSWVHSIQEGLLTGSSFHKELEKIGFSDTVCSQVYLAAQYGNYGETIARCGEQLLDRLNKQKKFRSLASYPIFLLFFLVGMLLLMRYMILPNMESIFLITGSEQELLSNGIVSLVYNSPQIILGFFLLSTLGGIILVHSLKKKSMLQKTQFFMKFPILQLYIKDYYSHFFFFEWGHLFMNGCSFQDIVQIMQGRDSSKILKETGGHLSSQMKQGSAVHEAISTLPFFHEEGLLVISHGENLGKLGMEMLIYSAYCSHQLNIRIEKLMDSMQPIIFSLVAVMILAIYAALMLPIFTLMEGF